MLLSALLLGVLQSRLDLYAWADHGNDTKDGRSWRSAFGTIQHALAAVPTGDHGPVTIHLRGTFHVDQPIVVDSLKDVTISGSAVISGAAPITDWRQDSYNGISLWSAPVPSGLAPIELFTGTSCTRAERPRLPETGFYHLAGLTNNAMDGPWNSGQAEALFTPGDIPQLSQPEAVELVAHHLWSSSRLPIASVDYDTHLVQFKKKSVFRLAEDFTKNGAPYYLDNVREALKRPGQWYWDQSASRIYYVPGAHDSLRGFIAEVPKLTNVLIVRHTLGLNLDHIAVRGAEWSYPADIAGDHQAAISVPGAVLFDGSGACSMTDCSVTASGTYGVDEVNGSTGLQITHCTFQGLGAGGVKLNHGTSGATIDHCMIADDGLVEANAVGIWVGNSGHNVIRFNKVQNLSYSGISLGWTWGYGPSKAVSNIVSDNVIDNIGMGLLSDMGGIYSLGVSPGTVFEHNRISNVHSLGYGGWGIYLDEGSSQILVQNNIVTGCKTGSFHQHYGQDNVIRNNIFEFADEKGQIVRTKPEDHNSFTMERNIIVWKGTPLFSGDMKGPGFVFKNNLLWKTDGKPQLPPFVDSSNVVADPRLGPEFQVPADSPALQIGFTPISPVTGAG